MYTPASTAAEYRFQGNQPKIQNAYNYKKQVITGIHGLPFDQQNDDRYWQTKQILPNILRPLGSGIKNAAIINEGVYNINPIAGTNNFGGSDISLASGTNPTNYSIVNTTDIEDRLRAHAVPANDPLSAEYAVRLAPDAQMNPNSVEGDPMLNTFRSDESIMRNAASQIYDENLMPDGEDGEVPNESLVYGRLRMGLHKAQRAMRNIHPNEVLRRVLFNEQVEAVRRSAAQAAGQVYDASNRRKDLAAQAGNVGDTPGAVLTPFAAGTFLNRPAFQAHNGRVGVVKSSKIGGSVMSQVDVIDNQNPSTTTNNLKYTYKSENAVKKAGLAKAMVEPIAFGSIPQKETGPPLPKTPSKTREKAINRKDFTIGAGFGTQPGSMEIDPKTMRAFDEPATILSPQRVSDTTRESYEADRTQTSEIDFAGAIREFRESDNEYMRQFGTSLSGASNPTIYGAFRRLANQSDNDIEQDALQAYRYNSQIDTNVNLVGNAIASFIPRIPVEGKPPAQDPSEVKYREENMRLQKERDDAINQLAVESKITSDATTQVLKQQKRIMKLEEALENARATNSNEANDRIIDLQEQLHDARKVQKGFENMIDTLANENKGLRFKKEELQRKESAASARLSAGMTDYENLQEAYRTLSGQYSTLEAQAMEDASGLMKMQDMLHDMDRDHKAEIDELRSRFNEVAIALEEAKGQRMIDIDLIQRMQAEGQQILAELRKRESYIDPAQVQAILNERDSLANRIKYLEENPIIREKTIRYDTYTGPSFFEGRQAGDRPGKRKFLESTARNSLVSDDMLAGSIPTEPLPTPTNNKSATNQLSADDNQANVIDDTAEVIDQAKATRDYARKVVGKSEYEQAREETLQSQAVRRDIRDREIKTLVARVGRLVEVGKRQGYFKEDEGLVQLYVDEIMESVANCTLLGNQPEVIVGAVNAALEGSFVRFYSLRVNKNNAEVVFAKKNLHSNYKYFKYTARTDTDASGKTNRKAPKITTLEELD